jgi:AcrR family transcriptional regulator
MTEPDDTRQRLLDVAGPIFAEKGLKATSVRNITDAAGTSPAAVNYYFRSKEQMYVEAVKHAYESIAAKAPMPQWPAGMPAEQRLRAFIRAFLTRLLVPRGPEWHGLLIMRECSQPTEACVEFVRNFVRPTFTVLQGILDELLPAAVPPRTRHLLGASIIGQCLHYHNARWVLPMLVGQDEYRGYDVDTLAEHIAAFSLAALKGLYCDSADAGSQTSDPPRPRSTNREARK